MRGDIRTLGHETQVAEIAMIHDLPVVRFIDPIELHGWRVVHQVEQRGKGVTETYAAATAVADIEDALDLLREHLFVVEPGLAPLERMARRRLEAAFALFFDCHGHL